MPGVCSFVGTFAFAAMAMSAQTVIVVQHAAEALAPLPVTLSGKHLFPHLPFCGGALKRFANSRSNFTPSNGTTITLLP